MLASCSAIPAWASKRSTTHVGTFDRLKRLNNGELFDCLKHFAFAAQASGIDQGVIAILILELDLDGVARSPGMSKAISDLRRSAHDQRALACVRTAGDRNFNLVFEILFLIDFLFGREGFKNQIHQGFNTFAVYCGNGVRLA